MDAGFTRRKELVCTLSEMEENGAVVLLDREVIYVRQDDGEYLIKIGDGKTALSDLPYATTKAKLYRHSISVYKSPVDKDSEGNDIEYGTASFGAYLTVYRSTDTPLTLDDLTSAEIRQFKVTDFLYTDSMDAYRPVQQVYYDSRSKTFSVHYFYDIYTIETLSCNQYNHTVNDTVTEV